MEDQFDIDAVDQDGQRVNFDRIGKGEGHVCPEEARTTEGLLTHLERWATDFWMKPSDEDRDDPSRGFIPTIVAVCGNGEIQHVVLNVPFDEENKDRIVRAMRHQFKQWGVVRYGFVSEAWAATYKVFPQGTDEDERVQPSEHPERREIMNIVVADREGAVFVSALDIKRDYNGIVRNIVKNTDMQSNPGSFGGRFASLLKEGPESAEDGDVSGMSSPMEFLKNLSNVLIIPDEMESVLNEQFSTLRADGETLFRQIAETVKEVMMTNDPAEGAEARMRLMAHLGDVKRFVHRVGERWKQHNEGRDPDDTGVRH